MREEPRLNTAGGLLYKKAGTVNPTKLLVCLENELGHNAIKTNFKIAKISEKNSIFTIQSADGKEIRAIGLRLLFFYKKKEKLWVKV